MLFDGLLEPCTISIVLGGMSYIFMVDAVFPAVPATSLSVIVVVWACMAYGAGVSTVEDNERNPEN